MNTTQTTWYYSPHTGEIIHTTQPATWMGSTHQPPPPHQPGAQSCLYQQGTWQVADIPPPAPVVPAVISKRQASRALLDAGLLEAVEAAIAQSPPAVQIDWRQATMIERSWPALAALAPAMGLTDAQLDALFIAGSQL